MSHVISVSARVPAAAARVYAVIADYRNGHPHILPDRFTGLTVERGGYGAGTLIRFGLRFAGRVQMARAEVTEPEPGRVLVETIVEGNPAVTTFTVRPSDEGQACEVTISTEIPARPGLRGAIERFLSTRLLRPVYEEELKRLAAFVASSAQARG
jgi:hypothetical protein